MKGATENEMVEWHHLLNEHEFEQTLGDSEDKEAWHATAHGVAKSWTSLSNRTTTVATHSSHLSYRQYHHYCTNPET